MTDPHPSVLAIHPVLAGFRLNPVAGGKDLAAGVCTEVLLEMGCKTSVWPLDWSGEGAAEKICSPHEIFWGDSGRIRLVPTCSPPSLRTIQSMLAQRRPIKPQPPTAPGCPPPPEPVGPSWDQVDETVWRQALGEAFCRPLDRVPDVLREVRPQLLHVHQTQNPLVRFVKQLSPKTPALLSNHSGVISSFIADYDWVVVPSHWMHDAIVAQHPQLAPRVQVIPYFLQPEYLEEAPPAEAREGITFIGLLSDDRKGLDILLVALVLLAKAGLRIPLHVIGEGTLVPAYKMIAKANKVEATFHGKLTTRENLARLRQSSLFVMPSRVENFPIVYLEALACGTPVIGYPPAVDELNRVLGEEVGSCHETAKSGPHELAQLIRLWHEEKCPAFAPRRAAVQNRVRALYSPAAYRAAYRQLYERLLSS
jgi:glycosyltransferase involved in cell wall biosynthesis